MRDARKAARDEQAAARCWTSSKPTHERRPGPGGRPPTIRGGLPRPTCSRRPGPGVPPPRTPTPTRLRPRRCARARNACARSIPTRWTAMTGSAPREPARSTRCARPPRCSPASRTRVPASPARAPARGSLAARCRPEPGVTDGSLRRPPGPDPYQEAEHRGRQIVWRLQARALPSAGLNSALKNWPRPWSRHHPARRGHRTAGPRPERGSVAAGAERARAADLGHARPLHSGSERAEDLRAARRETQIADTAGAHASADRSAAQLAAESFPCTAADGIRAAATGQPSAAGPATGSPAAVHERQAARPVPVR